jgi:hypothetical protein
MRREASRRERPSPGAAEDAVALDLVVLLALPPFLLQFGLGLLQSVSDWAETSRILAAACLVTFGVLQFFAIEAATLIVLREAVLPKIDQR